MRAEPKIEAPKPPPAPPPEPPSPWTSIWRSEKAKASLRISVSKEGITGYYSAPNGFYAPGDIERAELKGDVLTFSVVLGNRRHGMRVEKSGDTISVFKWVDIDGLRDEYRIVEAARAGRSTCPRRWSCASRFRRR
jgi:hypothetical protein